MHGLISAQVAIRSHYLQSGYNQCLWFTLNAWFKIISPVYNPFSHFTASTHTYVLK